MRISFNEHEDDALHGLRWQSQVIYIRGMRRFMDYQTGIVGGRKRRISYQMLMEISEQHPVQGSNVNRGTLSRSALRSSIGELQRAGLVQPIDNNSKYLIFRLMLADSDQSVQNKNDHRTTKEQPCKSDHDEPSNHNGFDGMNDHRTTNPLPPKNDIHPISDIRYKTTNVVMSGEAPNVSQLHKARNKKHRESAIKVIAFLNEKARRNYQNSESNMRLIIARLKEGATEMQCRQVIAKKTREWYSDEKMNEYLRPATLFNATKFSQYVGELVIVEEQM